MMQKRSLYSLLLTSFMLVFAFSLSMAQEVTFESKSALRGETSALNITVDNPSDISAFEVVFTVTEGSGGAFFTAMDVDWDPLFGVLLHRYVDLSSVDYVSPDTVRIAGMMIDAGDGCLALGSTVVGQLEFTTNDVCAGEIVIDGTTLTIDKCGGVCSINATTQFVDCATTEMIPAAVNAGTVTINNVPPTLDPIADATIHWGDTYVGTATADDDDLQYAFESLTFTKVSGPANLTVNATSGVMQWATTGADVGSVEVCIEVMDACGAADTTCFDICVQNTPPELTCPTDTNRLVWGY